jgi:hypothetical protein
MTTQSVVNWYWNRLRCMSPGEIAHRAVRAVKIRLEESGIGLAHPEATPDVLRGEFRPFVLGGPGIPADPYVRAADEILAGTFRVFALDYAAGVVPRWNRDPKSGREGPLVFGKSLDYRNESVVGDIKYVWEPNRHLHLVTLAQAWHLTDEQRFLYGLKRQIESWLDQCPYPLGPNWTSSLELAIRLINWSIVWQLIGGQESRLFADDEGRRLRSRWLESIYQHLHLVRGHLSRFSSANNHLIGEVAGLFVGAVTWPHWNACGAWADDAKEILEREALLQNGDDGVNREQAISYQQFVLDFLVIPALAGRANGREFSADYWRRIEAMMEYLASVMDAGGNVPMIGDADDGYAVWLSQEPDFCPYRSLLATGAVLFGRADFRAKAGDLDDKTRWLLGTRAQASFHELHPDVNVLPVRRSFPVGGYYILGCKFETEQEIRAIVDAGPLGYLGIAAHGHADALAMTLSVGGKEFLIDPGTYAYHTQKKWRDYFRGTSAHNTVAVDDENQSVIGGNFMWMQKASARCIAWESDSETDRFVGSHDGYLRLADPVLHRREVLLDKDARKILVTDTLECRGSHRAQCSWHFSEDCSVVLDDDHSVVASNGQRAIRLRLRNPTLKFQLHRKEESPPCGWVSRKFDVKEQTTTARVNFDVVGSVSVETEISCD